MTISRRVVRFVVCAALAGAALPAFSQKIRVLLGTPAPEGSVWHDVLLQMSQDWRKISGGQVEVIIRHSGVLGEEVDMLRKVRTGEIQAVALSGAGLSHADPGVSCLQIPLLLESYEEFDYVRDRIAPKLEERFRARGFVVLNWSDAGWVYFFTKKPVRTLGEIRKLKLWTSPADPETEKLYRDFGFQPVPIGLNDLHLQLKIGAIEAFDVPALMALLQQTFSLAGNMIEIKWAPLVAATLISTKAWERIPAAMRPELERAARRAGEQERGRIRRLGDEAVVEMRNRKLNVIQPDAAMLASWRAEAEAAYPKLRGSFVPADLFDEVVRLRDEFRASRQSKAAGDGAGAKKP